MNELFNGSSASQRGTLYHMKNRFVHRSVKKHVMENVPHVYDLLDFAADSIVCLAALSVIGVESVAEIRLPDVDAEKYMTDLCRDIVTMLWPQTSEVDFTSDAPNDAGGDDDGGDDEDTLYCSCRRTEPNMQCKNLFLKYA